MFLQPLTAGIYSGWEPEETGALDNWMLNYRCETHGSCMLIDGGELTEGPR